MIWIANGPRCRADASPRVLPTTGIGGILPAGTLVALPTAPGGDDRANEDGMVMRTLMIGILVVLIGGSVGGLISVGLWFKPPSSTNTAGR